MLPPTTLEAIQDAARQLIRPLMSLARAASKAALTGGTPTLSNDAAFILFHRLSRFIVALTRIARFPFRARTAATARPGRAAAARHRDPVPNPAPRMPRRSGWLLHALPDAAPTVAAALEALLADPATAALLTAAPGIGRTLNPFLRSLGLHLPAPPRPREIRPPPRTLFARPYCSIIVTNGSPSPRAPAMLQPAP